MSTHNDSEIGIFEDYEDEGKIDIYRKEICVGELIEILNKFDKGLTVGVTIEKDALKYFPEGCFTFLRGVRSGYDDEEGYCDLYF